MTTSITTQEQQSNTDVAVNDLTPSGILDSTFVSYANRITENQTSSIPLASIIEQIRTSADLQKSVSIIRAASSDKERQELKAKHLPYFTFLQFENGIRKKDNFIGTKFLVMDLDHVQERINSLSAQMRTDSKVFMFFRSPSGDGLKTVFALAKEIKTEAEYKKAYLVHSAEFSKQYGVITDATNDVARACFLSYDPDLYVNPDADLLPAEPELFKPIAEEPVKRGEDIRKALKGSTPGGRTAGMTAIIGLFINKGFDREFTLEFIRAWNKGNIPPHTDDKLVATVDDLFKRYERVDFCKDIWSYESDILQAGIVGEEFYLHRIGPRKAFSLLGARSKEDRDRLFDYIVQNKHIPHLKRVNFLGDIGAEKSYYRVHVTEGIIDVNYAPIPIIQQDNDFIEQYLASTFGRYKDFIKEYMAVYTYTNYKKLPTLVLKGGRTNGKNTFAEMVADIYKPLAQPWHGNEKEFNPEVEKKLLISEETVTDDPAHYKMLKKLSGSATNMVNKKHQQPYEVANNLNMILLSNAHTPIFVQREELPKDEGQNQFFVYEFSPIKGKVDPEMGKKLKERLGYYIRTELKVVFDSLNLDGKRYSINVPITEAERQLFNNNSTDVEDEADYLIQRIVDKQDMNPDNEYKDFIEGGYLPVDYILEWYGDKKMRRKAIKNLKERGYLEERDSDRPQIGHKRRYSYKMTERLTSLLQPDVLPVMTVNGEKESEVTVTGIDDNSVE